MATWRKSGPRHCSSPNDWCRTRDTRGTASNFCASPEAKRCGDDEGRRSIVRRGGRACAAAVHFLEVHMANPVQGDDNGIGFGVKGTSVAARGVHGISRQYVGVWGDSSNPNLGSIWGDSQVNVGAGVVGNIVNSYGLWGPSSTEPRKMGR